MSAPGEVETVKKERSPSFPFISLSKAVERLRALYSNHKLQPARVISVATSWGYAVKSSGLLQTVAALKQYGLVEDAGSGEERKIQISDLGRRILQDERPGAREAALKEAAKKPRLIGEYLSQWVPDRPSDSHCISELQLDRGFTDVAAKLFLHVFDETVSYAKLAESDSMSPNLEIPRETEQSSMQPAIAPRQPERAPAAAIPGRFDEFFGEAGPKPFNQRLKIELTAHSLGVSAVLLNAAEVDKLIKMLEANKMLLTDNEPDAFGTVLGLTNQA